MKHLILYIIFAGLLTSCSSVKQHYNNGRYDLAIKEASSKLHRKGKLKTKHALAFEKAFNIEKSILIDKVEDLKLSGDPNCWVEIYELYDKMDIYQKQIKPYLPVYIEKEMRNADIQLINITTQKADAKLKATEYLYARGNELLEKNNKLAARDAFFHFEQAKSYYSSFRDIDNKLDEAYSNGQNHIELKLLYQANAIVPQDFVTNIKAFQPQELNTQWTKFHWDNTDVTEDYSINIRILNVDIGPEQIRETEYQDIKEIVDGSNYVLDANGNVVKDSLGNDVTTPNIVNIRAIIQKSAQHKEGVLNYMVELTDQKGKIIKQIPMGEQLIFHNEFARFTGDERALTKESKTLIGGAPAPFPTDVQMVMNASENVKINTINAIRNHIYLLNV